MSVIDMLIGELTQEVNTAKKHFERLPDEKFDFKPHEKSMPMGRLAAHTVETLGWIPAMINEDVFEFNPMEYTPVEAKNTS